MVVCLFSYMRQLYAYMFMYFAPGVNREKIVFHSKYLQKKYLVHNDQAISSRGCVFIGHQISLTKFFCFHSTKRVNCPLEGL